MSPRRAAWALSALLVGCATVAPPPLPIPPVHPGGQALWRITHDLCVPNQRARGDPGPCSAVSMPDGEARGFVVLKDRVGATQVLVIPTARITGIEDPAVLAPDAANYFADAWAERGLVERRLGRPLDRTRISIAVNSLYGRSQDQLHLHVDCLDRSVADLLAAARIPREGRWTAFPLKGHAYRVRWLDDAELARTSPFELVARDLPGARQAMGAWTLALVGARGPDGADGFYLLADRADPAKGDHGSAEEVQDHTCRS